MAYDLGVNFRGTAGYVTDDVNETYCLAADTYPTTRGGATFGWDVSVQATDRSAAVDRRLAGIAFDTGALRTFRLDLPSLGGAVVHLAIGDHGGGGLGDETVEVKDNTTSLFTIGPHDMANWGVGAPNERFYDATDVMRYPCSGWASDELGAFDVFATTALKVEVATTGTWVLAHVRVVQIGVGISPSCLIPAYREIVFDPDTGLVTAGFVMHIYLSNGTRVPEPNPDSASVTFDSTQAWSVTKAAILAAVIARADEFGISLDADNVIVHLPTIERG